jgi:nucleolar GTP-binding protein
MFKIPTILNQTELLNKAFHRASKISENQKIKNRVQRKKKQIISKIDTVTDIIDSTLSKYISAYPSFDRLHKFEFELVNITVGVDKLRKALGSIDWARQQVRKLGVSIKTKVNKIRGQNEYSKIEQLNRMFYGRVSSIIKQVGNKLDFLNSARDHLRKLPNIDPELTTVVVAGYPNVGKSLLVKQISSAKPLVAKYPFTTKQLNIGHLTIKNHRIQIIDTPGLLDRSPEQRNKIERQAIMALRYLADLIIFILDPSEHCGYIIEEQNKLLTEIKAIFNDVQIIEIENKIDLFQPTSERLKISALDGQGLDDILLLIEKSILSTNLSL